MHFSLNEQVQSDVVVVEDFVSERWAHLWVWASDTSGEKRQDKIYWERAQPAKDAAVEVERELAGFCNCQKICNPMLSVGGWWGLWAQQRDASLWEGKWRELVEIWISVARVEDFGMEELIFIIIRIKWNLVLSYAVKCCSRRLVKRTTLPLAPKG